MSFNESQHPRATAGVSTGGQFVTKAAAESPVDLTADDELAFHRAAEAATLAIIPLLQDADDATSDGPVVHWPHEPGEHDPARDIYAGVQVFADAHTSGIENGQWGLQRGLQGESVTARAGLSMAAHPAAVAAWLRAAREASDEDLTDYPISVRDDGISRAVAAELEGVAVWDEGGGTTIWFGSRTEPGATGDHAFIVPAGDGDHGGRWQFQSDDVSDSPEGYRNEVVTSDLTVESDPKVVAAWVREQAEKFGSVPYSG